ncbi:HNH endonuclease family protein [Nocardioides aestuarii]|uniref:HNH endonuclease family protein n=1 Tax=Nocardioides aestuarii TaxID=252231 RepID=A0ABW4TFA2_9ACTN
MIARLLALALLVSGLALGAAAPAAPTASAVADRSAETRLGRLVRRLDVGRERAAGYDREKFVHWVDVDGDGCDTRDEVLRQEAVDDPTVGDGCSLSGGEWFSWYDAEQVTDSSDLDIDHLVPLAEAWASGARGWTAGTRRRFANDLGDRRSLTAVTASSNRTKSDGDPAEWLPRKKARCRYIRDWVVVKSRWQLRVDRTEKRTVRRLVRRCGSGGDTVRFTRARVVRR